MSVSLLLFFSLPVHLWPSATPPPPSANCHRRFDPWESWLTSAFWAGPLKERDVADGRAVFGSKNGRMCAGGCGSPQEKHLHAQGCRREVSKNSSTCTKRSPKKGWVKARGGGRRKEKARVHELVRGFGHPRANDRTDAANQGDAVQSELRNRTNREFTEPVHEPVRQFARSTSKAGRPR